MTGGVVVRRRSVQCKTKVKTGCATCRSVPILTVCLNPKGVFKHQIAQQYWCLHCHRIRKIKCDEGKPFCKRCVGTGRTCDGYESPFVLFASGQAVVKAHNGNVKSSSVLRSFRPSSMEIAPQDIELLSRCFSTKTLFDVKLGCGEEARQVLQASVTSAATRHAVLSLRALREDLETHGDVLASVAQQTLRYDYGLQQYCMALGGLAADLSEPGANKLKSALLCCQMFISIEQVQGNYAGMARHLIQGLRVMDQYRARPKLVSTNRLVPVYHDQLPLLDIFIIKLFAAPCKFAEPPDTPDLSGTAVTKCPLSLPQEHASSRDLRLIVPDRRADLTKIATMTMKFLGEVSRVRFLDEALQLLSQKAYLLNSLALWLLGLELDHKLMAPHGPEPISVTFMRLFHQVLRMILVGSLHSSPELYAELRIESDRFLDIAGKVDERLQTLRKRDIGPTAQGEPLKSR
jgi:hypothetical protein